MCGIFGYIGPKDMTTVLVNGLLRLEYRGYDSAGVAILEPKLRVVKAKGRIKDLQAKLTNSPPLSGNIGIAHTRWATHGEPNEKNAHPHTCNSGKIAIVHNGIIENYHALRKYLQGKGHTFASETDSELVAHLIEENMKGDALKGETLKSETLKGEMLKSETLKGKTLNDETNDKKNKNAENKFFIAFQKSLAMLEGAFGIAAIKEGEEQILVARRGSPLIIGVGEHEMFVSSDAAAIVEHTKRVINLEDNEAAAITQDSHTITDFHNRSLQKDIMDITWDLKTIELVGFTHFMQKEIFEQPETVKNAFRGRLATNEVRLDGLREIRKQMDIQRITLVACGTSNYSGMIGEYLISSLCRIPARSAYASEFRYSNPIIEPGELVIGISQSGETADTLAALKLAHEQTKTFGIVNAVGSLMAKETDAGIYIHAGPEIGVASTKAFTGQVTCLYLLAIELAKGKIDYATYKKALQEIPDKISRILEEEDHIKKIAEMIAKHDNALYLGRGINYPVAMEGALKLKEISGIHAEGYPAAEMKHGPIALIDENMPVIFIATGKNGIYEKILSNMQEVKARRGRIVAIASHKDERLHQAADYVIIVPETIEELSPLLNVIPLQLLAYHAAVMRGKNPDKPRNLAKAVTVE
jgi:glucosamine--fructose-6-phosphate aminotransferase (isomerizing)